MSVKRGSGNQVSKNYIFGVTGEAWESNRRGSLQVKASNNLMDRGATEVE